MAGSEYLLDTNIIAAILNQEPDIEAQLAGKAVYLSSIALGELYFGAYKSARVDDNRKRIARLATRFPLLVCDHKTAERYGEIKLLLKQKGRPIPENDIWIAAMARQHDLILTTRDAHFNEVDDLTLANW